MRWLWGSTYLRVGWLLMRGLVSVSVSVSLLLCMQMSKHAKKLEKENAAMQKKCAAYDLGAIATVEEKLRAAEDTKKQLEKIRKLESLCRQLQAERHSVRDTKQVVLPESA